MGLLNKDGLQRGSAVFHCDSGKVAQQARYCDEEWSSCIFGWAVRRWSKSEMESRQAGREGQATGNPYRIESNSNGTTLDCFKVYSLNKQMALKKLR